MATKLRKTSKPSGDFTEGLYNEGEARSYEGLLEEMNVEQVRVLLEHTGWSTV